LSFYAEISEVYDDLFPVSEAQASLLDSLRKETGARSVVDCGCGTGAQLVPFAVSGVECLGLDPDPALVAVAREKLAAWPNVRIEEGGFADFKRLAGYASDLLLCLGNSLVHVTREQAGRFLADAAQTLSPRGQMLLQILNYERLLRDGMEELAPIRSADGFASLDRRCIWEDRRKLMFHTILEVSHKDRPRITCNEIPLYPVYPEELYEMIKAVGFKDIRFFGDFSRNAFSANSEAVVCIARKA
jgi:SAM-dependent methyltransferase